MEAVKGLERISPHGDALTWSATNTAEAPPAPEQVDPAPSYTLPPDPYDMRLRLCDHEGMVSLNWVEDDLPTVDRTYLERAWRLKKMTVEGRESFFANREVYRKPWRCTGHAHYAGMHIRCTSPAHRPVVNTPPTPTPEREPIYECGKEEPVDYVSLDQTTAPVHYEGGPTLPGTCPVCGSDDPDRRGRTYRSEMPRGFRRVRIGEFTAECGNEDFHGSLADTEAHMNLGPIPWEVRFGDRLQTGFEYAGAVLRGALGGFAIGAMALGLLWVLAQIALPLVEGGAWLVEQIMLGLPLH